MHYQTAYAIIIIMVKNQETINQNEHEKHATRHKVGQFIGRLGLVAACIVPTADLALSDIGFAKAYEITQENVNLASDPIERAVETGIMGSLIMAESIGLGVAITKTKKLQNAFNDFDEYIEEKHQNMSKPRRLMSKTVNAPFSALQKIGTGFEKIGEKISSRKTRVARSIGKLAVEAGQVNALGTSTVIMQETMANNPPTLRRNTRLAGIIAASWLGVAEGVRSVYRSVPVVRPPMAAIGKGYELLTTINMAHPWETPVGSIAISSTALALAYTGWRIGEFHQQREEIMHVPIDNISTVPLGVDVASST